MFGQKHPQDLVPVFFNSGNFNSYDRIVNYATFGRDNHWKHAILKELSAEATVLDLACGTCILTEQIAKKLQHAQIVGVDITEKYLEKAREKLISYPNISLVHQDAEKLSLSKKFDCITASYLPKYCTSDVLIKNCLKHLNPDGKIILHDFTYPTNSMLQKLWNSYFKLLYLAGFLLPHWKQVFVDLPHLIRSRDWVSEYSKTMQDYGLSISRQDLTHNTSSILVGTDVS